MGLVEKRQLVDRLSPPLHNFLATQLVDEFVSLERRYIQRDWEPAELDGGQFCEVLGRILYHLDSGNLSLDREFGDCVKYLFNDQVPHALDTQTTRMLAQVLQTVYKFRSKRGGVHVSSSYGPNQMDARMMIENVRWAMNETLRVFWNGDRDAVAKTIRELLQFDVPCIGVFEEAVMVQRTDLTVDEELLVLLHYAGEAGMSRTALGRFAMPAAPRVTEALQRLTDKTVRQVVQLASGAYRLTDLGSKRIREQLADKLLVQ